MKRVRLAADVATGFFVASLLSLLALSSFWLIEQSGKLLRLGWDATLMKDMKVVGTMATFLTYYILEIRELWRGGADDDN